MDRIQTVIGEARRQGRPVLMPYFPLGFPDPEQSLRVVEAAAAAGADLIELGVPFSDPLADGPTIQRAAQVALEQGMSVRRALEMTAELRRRGVTQPLLLMGYYNPFLAYGAWNFVEAAAAAGADGLIVPDLPVEEAGEMESACRTHGLALVYLLAPTSTPERIERVVKQASGFLYLVSLTGVTGARKALPPDLAAFIARVRAATDLPLAVGFGIATPEQARQVGGLADGVIVGSALVTAVEQAQEAGEDPAQAAASFVSGLRAALEAQTIA